MEGYGARFGGPATEEKTSYPNAHSLYFSGNELTVPGRAMARPAQRGHRAKPEGGGEPTALSGQYLLPPLIRRLEAKPNVRLWRQTRATRLVVDASGAVVGIEVQRMARGSPPGGTRRRGHWRTILSPPSGLTARFHSLITRLEQSKSPLVRIRVSQRRGADGRRLCLQPRDAGKDRARLPYRLSAGDDCR